jgi:hypothetical protein
LKAELHLVVVQFCSIALFVIEGDSPMYDRPSAIELLQASRGHFETQILPLAKAHNFKLYFQTLVAINVIRIVEREIELGSMHAQAQDVRLMALLGQNHEVPRDSARLKARVIANNTSLCQQIRKGEHDDTDSKSDLFDHLLQTSIEQLTVANPKFLGALAKEDAQG